MQGEAGLALVLFEHEVVEVHFLPVLEHLRLALGKTRAHREAGLGHIQRAFVIHVASPLYDKLLFCSLFDHLAGENDQPAFPAELRVGEFRERVAREHRRIIVIERPQFYKVGRRFEKPQLLLRPEGILLRVQRAAQHFFSAFWAIHTSSSGKNKNASSL